DGIGDAASDVHQGRISGAGESPVLESAPHFPRYRAPRALPTGSLVSSGTPSDRVRCPRLTTHLRPHRPRQHLSAPLQRSIDVLRPVIGWDTFQSFSPISPSPWVKITLR